MKLYYTEHDIEQSECLGKIIGISDKVVLEHFKEAIPPKIKPQWLEIKDTQHITIGKAIDLIPLSK